MTNPYSAPLAYPTSAVTTVPVQHVAPEKKKTATPWVLGSLVGGAAGGALIGYKTNPYISKSGEVSDSFAREVLEKYVNKNNNPAQKMHEQANKILDGMKKAKSPDELKALLNENKELATKICEEAPDDFIKTVTKENLNANKESLVKKITAENEFSLQKMKNWIQSCWDKANKEFKKSADVCQDAFDSIKDATKVGKNKLIAKYAAIGGVATALASFVIYNIVKLNRAKKQAQAIAQTQSINIR